MAMEYTVGVTQVTSAKQELHRLIDEMTKEQAEDLLDFINMQKEPDTLTPEEEAAFEAGKAEIERGEFITREELLKKYDL
jgi:predicted transcriptional regulator